MVAAHHGAREIFSYFCSMLAVLFNGYRYTASHPQIPDARAGGWVFRRRASRPRFTNDSHTFSLHSLVRVKNRARLGIRKKQKIALT